MVHPHSRVFGASWEHIPRPDGYSGCFGQLHVTLQGLGSCWSSKAGSLWPGNVEINYLWPLQLWLSPKLVFVFWKVCSASLLRCCAHFPQLQMCESWLEKYLACWKCPVQLHWKNPCGFWAACACAVSDSELVPAGKSTRLSVTYLGLDREAAGVVNAVMLHAVCNTAKPFLFMIPLILSLKCPGQQSHSSNVTMVWFTSLPWLAQKPRNRGDGQLKELLSCACSGSLFLSNTDGKGDKWVWLTLE